MENGTTISPPDQQELKKQVSFQESVVDSIDEQTFAKRHRFSRPWWKTLKILYIVFLFVAVLAALIISRATLSRFGNSTDNAEKLASLYVIGLFPHVMYFILNLLVAINRDVGKKPTTLQNLGRIPIYVMEFIFGALQGLGQYLFLFLVIPKLAPVEIMIALQAFAVGPILCIVFGGPRTLEVAQETKTTPSNSENKTPESKKKVLKEVGLSVTHYILQSILLAAQVVGLVFLIIASHSWILIFATLLISISWWRNYVGFSRLPQSLQNSYRLYYHSSAVVSEFAQILVIGLLGFFTMSPLYGFDSSTFGSALGTIWHSSSITTVFYFNLFSNLLAFLLIWMSILSTVQRFSFAIPFLLSSPIALIWEWVCSPSENNFVILGVSNCNPYPFNGFLLIAFFLLWISTLFTVVHIFDGLTPYDSNMKQLVIWNSPNYSFFPDYLAFNRRRLKPLLNNFAIIDEAKDFTFVVATMYNETETETLNMLNSIADINAKVPMGGKEGYEFHITVDNAIKSDDTETTFSEFTLQLLKILKHNFTLKKKANEKKWYGRLLVYQFASGRKIKLHLKDSTKVKRRKRWSQIIYLSEIIKTIMKNPDMRKYYINTFLLTLDGDTSFTKESVDILKKALKRDPAQTGAVVGRIIPVSKPSCLPNFWVKYQQFDYAAGHWFQKTAEDVFGSVLCASGCFSMIRMTALTGTPSSLFVDPGKSVIEAYAEEAQTATDIHRLDQGEDRMLTTLILQNGWSIRYAPVAIAKTFCPTTMYDLFVQRRRWVASTIINTVYVMRHMFTISRRNSSMSIWFMFYISAVFFFSLLTPSTIVVLVTLGMSLGWGLRDIYSVLISLAFPILYLFICTWFVIDLKYDRSRIAKQRKTKIQVYVAQVFMFLYGALFMVALGRMFARVVTNIVSPDTLFTLTVAGMIIIAGILHGEILVLLSGILYMLLLPTMYLILPIFVIANMHDHSWGTRETVTGEVESASIWSIFIPHWIRCHCTSSEEAGEDNMKGASIRKNSSPSEPAELSETEEELSENEMLEQAENLQSPEENEIQPVLTVEDLNVKEWRRIRNRMERTTESKSDKILFRHLIDTAENLAGHAKVEKNSTTDVETQEKIRKGLNRLRNWWAIFLLVINSILAAFIIIVAVTDKINVPSLPGVNSISLFILFIFSTLLILQFWAMLVQRFSSLNEVISFIPLLQYLKFEETPKQKTTKKAFYAVLGRPTALESSIWHFNDQTSTIISRDSALWTPFQSTSNMKRGEQQTSRS